MQFRPSSHPDGKCSTRSAYPLEMVSSQVPTTAQKQHHHHDQHH
jgi:hypothetical protein